MSSANHRSPARTTAAFSPCRGSDSHCVWPVFASIAKYWPLLRGEKPNRLLPITTPVLMSIVASLLTHTSSDVHWPALFDHAEADHRHAEADTITIWLCTIGVTALRVARTV